LFLPTKWEFKIKKLISFPLLLVLFITANTNTAYSDEDDYYLGFYLTYTVSEIAINIKEWDEDFEESDDDEGSGHSVCDGDTCTVAHPPGRHRFGLAQENKGYGEFSGKLTLTSPDTFWGTSNFGYSFYTIYEQISSDIQTPGEGGEPIDFGTYIDATLISFVPAFNFIIGKRDDYNSTYLRFSIGGGLAYSQVDAKFVSKYSYDEDEDAEDERYWKVLEYEEVHFSGLGWTLIFLIDGRHLTFKVATSWIETSEYTVSFITRQYSLGFQIAF
jgi:hypothetical protein